MRQHTGTFPHRTLLSLTREIMVGLGRFELPTSRLSSARSNQLSYRPFKRVSVMKKEKRRRRHPALYFKEPGRQNTGSVILIRVLKRLGSKPDSLARLILRKEVIQPQVPLRLPCYDFTPVADLTVAGCLLAVSAPF
jgi:hypothetical protein